MLPPAMSSSANSPAPLPGRQGVLDAILAVADRAEEGSGGGLTLVGEPGIGKTAVLDRAAALLAARDGAGRPPFHVVRLRGVEAELELAWSCLAGLLAGLREGMIASIDRLAPARRSALRAALALDGTVDSVEPFAVGLATRDLLVDAAERGPIVVLVDDLQWVDAPTRRTLAFLARRLQFERIAVVSARRAGTDDSTDTGPAVPVGAVPDVVADQILVATGVTSKEVREALVAGAGGIPLVLVEAAHLLDDDQRSGRADLPDPLPIGPSGQRVVDLVLDRLGTRARAALVVAAADPDGDLQRILEALVGRGLGVEDLESAEDVGVIALRGDRLTFRHPLMRSAAYHDAPAGERRGAHRSLAATLPEGAPSRAWHLANAAVGPDEAAATALDEAAEVAVRRGAPTVASRSWELASRLSPRPADRVRRLRLAASAILDAGMTGAAGRLLDQADAVTETFPGADSVVERIGRRQLRCRLPLSSGGVDEAASDLRKAAAEVTIEAPRLALDLLVEALVSYIRSGSLVDMASVVEEAVVLRDVVDEDRARRIDVMLGAWQVFRGEQGGGVAMERYHEMVGSDRPATDAMFLAELVAPVLGFLRRSDESDRLLDHLEAELRARGSLRPLIGVLGGQSLSRYGRSFPACIEAGEEAIALAEANGTPELASLGAACLALASAVTGDDELNRRSAELLADVPEPERRAIGPIGRAYLDYNLGRYAEADAWYRHIVTLSPIGAGPLRWETEWIEALVRSGRRDEAMAVLAELELVVGPETLIVHGITRTRAMLVSDDDEAFELFAMASSEGELYGTPFSQGRIDFVWGERLRRARRKAEARMRLERAVAVLRQVGAVTYAERATSELRAAGGVIGDATATHQLLTAHELQVARLVVGGLSNRDLAAKLFISPRTVEAHLTAIFRKLGVRNRGQLAARALEDPTLQP